jgi:hypothetical protein
MRVMSSKWLTLLLVGLLMVAGALFVLSPIR